MARPALSAVAELLKPITWFPPMWAFGCGVVASGVAAEGRWPLIVVGVLLAGPLVCASSQAVNDWFDRHVDAINEPQRPIPSGRMPGRWGLCIAIVWTVLSLLVAALLGPWGFAAALRRPAAGLGLQRAAVAPEAERLVGQCRLRPLLRGPGLGHRRGGDGRRRHARAALAGAGAALQRRRARHHDAERFQVGRRRSAMGIGSLPVQLGVQSAARTACWVMLVPQLCVVVLLVDLATAGACRWPLVVLIALQLLLMRPLPAAADRARASGTAASACRCS